MSNPSSIGLRVRALREGAHLSQTALANASGVGRLTILNVELGRKKDLSLSEAVAIAGVLGITVDHLANAVIPPESLAIAEIIRDAQARIAQVLA